ncbi:MAG: DUF4465 domain-containing protein, partial [Cytophagales bacterium]|nr:DUF4465 domain-containing protein [Cytophagales bacterium]
MKHLVRLPGLSVAIVLMLFQFGLAQTLPDEYAMEAGAATKTVGSKGINFYDDGGAEANYSAMFEGTVTFIPLETGNKIKINFSEVDLGPANGSAKYSGDKIAIYQGTEAVKENLIGEYSSNNSEIGLIKSSAEDGALTIVFKSLDWTDFGYLPTAGWKATVSSFAPSPLSLAGLKVENACSVQSLRGKKNSPMLHISFSFEGETGSVSLDQLTFESAGTSDIANILQANVYYTGTSDIFSAENKFGAAATVAGSNFSFEKKLVINQEAVHHFWLAYDPAPDANLGDKLDAGFVSYQAGDESAEVAGGNPEGNTEIVSGLKGIYTLGASKEADFSTFEQLIGKINNLGIEESIVVEVEPGLYENCVIFPHAEGLSVEKTITVRSKTQNPEDVVFTPKLKGGTEKGIFHINGTDFLRLESMTFKTEQTRFESLVYMSGISRDNIIRNCVFEAPVYTDYTAHVNLFESKANNAENENNDRLWLDKNTFTGGYIAVYASGTGYVKLPKESGVRLTSNVLLNQGSKGIYLSNQKDALVEKNNVSNTQTAKIGFQGMDFYRMTGNSIVRGNQVYLALPGKMSAFGIEMRPASGSNEFPVQVYNNTVIVETGSPFSAGILLKDACEFLSLQHNSVLMKGESPQTALGIHARKSSQVPENVRIENNIFQTQSGEVIRTKYESFFNALSFSNNSIFSVGSEGSLAKISKEKSIKSIEEFNATGNAVNNLSEKADFLAPSILQLRSAGNLQSGKNIPEIATDIQGDARATVPTIGADEFREPDLIPPDFASSYPQAEAKDWQNLRLKAKIMEAGKLYGVVLPADAEVPTKEMLLDNSSADSKPFSIHFVKELSANAELTWEVAGLSQNADYRVYYLLSDFSVLKNTSEIISQLIKTPFKPTEISDFEGELTEKNGLIYNGTSSFENIVLMQDGTNKAAKILAGELAKVRFLNTASGIACKGFKYKAKSGAQMKLRKKQDGAEVIALPAAVNWTFFDLRKKGKLLGFDIQASTEDFYFDDVHGSSNKLKVMPLAEQRVSLGESITLEPEISGGYPPYSAEWVNLGTNKTYSGTKLTFAPESSGLYRFTVTDDNETSVFGEITVLVTRQAEQGTAEELALEPESYWNGPVNSKGISSGFYTGGYHFTNTKVTSWFTWGGFAYSNRTNKDEAGGLSNQFTAAPGKGANGSKNYLVSYTFGSKAELTVSHAEDGGTVNGFFVTNNTFATYSMKNGDSMAKK